VRAKLQLQYSSFFLTSYSQFLAGYKFLSFSDLYLWYIDAFVRSEVIPGLAFPTGFDLRAVLPESSSRAPYSPYSPPSRLRQPELSDKRGAALIAQGGVGSREEASDFAVGGKGIGQEWQTSGALPTKPNDPNVSPRFIGRAILAAEARREPAVIDPSSGPPTAGPIELRTADPKTLEAREADEKPEVRQSCEIVRFDSKNSSTYVAERDISRCFPAPDAHRSVRGCNETVAKTYARIEDHFQRVLLGDRLRASGQALPSVKDGGPCTDAKIDALMRRLSGSHVQNAKMENSLSGCTCHAFSSSRAGGTANRGKVFFSFSFGSR